MGEWIDYGIEKLKGKANWHGFELEMKAVWTMDGVWGVVSGRDRQPIEPQKPASVPSVNEDGMVIQAGQTVTPDELQAWEQRHKEWIANAEKWTKKNRKAKARLVLCTDDGPRQHIKRLGTCYEQWQTLRRIYGMSDLEIRDSAFLKIVRIKSASYGSIQAYTEAIQVQNAILKDIGFGLPNWHLSVFFRMGLEDGLGRYEMLTNPFRDL